MLYLVLAAIGSFSGCIACKGGGLAEVMRDIVQVAMSSWSPLESTTTWVFLENLSGCCWDTPLEVVILSLPWPTLEVGAGYRSGAGDGSDTTGLGCSNTF